LVLHQPGSLLTASVHVGVAPMWLQTSPPQCSRAPPGEPRKHPCFRERRIRDVQLLLAKPSFR